MEGKKRRGRQANAAAALIYQPPIEAEEEDASQLEISIEPSSTKSLIKTKSKTAKSTAKSTKTTKSTAKSTQPATKSVPTASAIEITTVAPGKRKINPIKPPTAKKQKKCAEETSLVIKRVTRSSAKI